MDIENEIRSLYLNIFADAERMELWYNRVHPKFEHSPAELVKSGRGEEFLEYVKQCIGRGSR